MPMPKMPEMLISEDEAYLEGWYARMDGRNRPRYVRKCLEDAAERGFNDADENIDCAIKASMAQKMRMIEAG